MPSDIQTHSYWNFTYPDCDIEPWCELMLLKNFRPLILYIKTVVRSLQINYLPRVISNTHELDVLAGTISAPLIVLNPILDFFTGRKSRIFQNDRRQKGSEISAVT